MMDEYVNLASIRSCTEAEGPGKRFAIWCQGCKKRCTGCCNPEMWELKARHIVSIIDLFGLIEEAKNRYGIEGVSIIGGEPFLQSNALANLTALCRRCGLSVLVFTGYTLEELRAIDDQAVKEFLSNIDVLVDGPFIKEQMDDERGWVGSKNQKVIYLSNRYASGIEYNNIQSVEFLFDGSSMHVNGWPSIEPPI